MERSKYTAAFPAERRSARHPLQYAWAISGTLMWIAGFSLAFPDQVPLNAGMGIQVAFLAALALLGLALLHQPLVRITGPMRLWALLLLVVVASLIPILVLEPLPRSGTSPLGKWATQVLQLAFVTTCAAGLWHTARRRQEFSTQLQRGLYAGAWFTVLASVVFVGFHLMGAELSIPHNNVSFGYTETVWRPAINVRDAESDAIRIFGFFSEPSFLSAYLAPLLLYALALWYLDNESRRANGWLALSLVVVVALSGGRTGQVAAVAALPLLVLFAKRRSLLAKAYFALAFLMVPLFLLAGALVGADTLGEADLSVIQRVAATVIGFEMFVDHPLLGVGYGSFGFHYPEYLHRFVDSTAIYEIVSAQAADESGLPFTFNVAVRFLAELGIVGFALFLLLCFRVIDRSVTSGEPRAMAAALGFLTFFIAGIDSFVMFQLWVFFVLAQPILYTAGSPNEARTSVGELATISAAR